MATIIIFISALLSLFHDSVGQGGNQYYYSNACGPQLQDIPNPASDSCTAFFRCYQNQQFSVRCPAGRAFDFGQARCRPANMVDCPLQLQRFQAPGIPHYLRPAGAAEDRRVEIRVIHQGGPTNPNNNNLLFLDGDGNRVPVTQQFDNRAQTAQTAQTAQSQIRTHPANPYLTRSIHDSPVAPQAGGTPIAPPSGTPNLAQGQGQLPRQNQPSRSDFPNPGPNPSVALPLQ